MNEQSHDLSALFRTWQRITLLRAALNVPTCTVQQIVAKTGASKGLVSPYLALLEREGLLVRRDRTYLLNNSAMTSAVKRLLNIDLVSRVFHKPGWALGIGMYGSWADGTNTDESDLDLWAITTGQPTGIIVAEVERDVSRALSVEVHILVLSREKVTAMKKSDEPFHRSFSKQSITLEGESPDAAF
jgi:hypothetical protein